MSDSEQYVVKVSKGYRSEVVVARLITEVDGQGRATGEVWTFNNKGRKVTQSPDTVDAVAEAARLAADILNERERADAAR